MMSRVHSHHHVEAVPFGAHPTAIMCEGEPGPE